jgi:hypothetical protein
MLKTASQRADDAEDINQSEPEQKQPQ